MLSIVALAAGGCGSERPPRGSDGDGGDGGSSSGDGGGGSGPGKCVEEAFVAWTDSTEDVVSLAKDAEGMKALVATAEGLVIVDAAGKKRVVSPITPEHSSYYGNIFTRQDDVICVAFAEKLNVAGDHNLMFACGEEAPVDTMLEPNDAGLSFDIPILPVPGSTVDEVYVYASEFAAVSLFMKSGSTWSDIELFESSISYPGDAIHYVNAPVACFIDQSDHVKLAVGSESDAGNDVGGEASDCKLATDGADLFVVADDRFATLTPATFMGGAFTTVANAAITGKSVKSMVAHKGNAYALTNDHKLVNLTTGKEESFVVPGGNAEDMIVDASGALTIAVLSDGKLLVGKHCLP